MLIHCFLMASFICCTIRISVRNHDQAWQVSSRSLYRCGSLLWLCLRSLGVDWDMQHVIRPQTIAIGLCFDLSVCKPRRPRILCYSSGMPL